jgi:hypothetical protein
MREFEVEYKEERTTHHAKQEAEFHPSHCISPMSDMFKTLITKLPKLCNFFMGQG